MKTVKSKKFCIQVLIMQNVDLLIKDLERQAQLKIMESRRESEALEASITTMYKVSGKYLVSWVFS